MNLRGRKRKGRGMGKGIGKEVLCISLEYVLGMEGNLGMGSRGFSRD